MILYALFSGCVDDSYHGAADRYNDDNIPMPVNVFVGNSRSPLTKGNGTADSVDVTTLDNHFIYVYAFNGMEDTDFSVTSSTNSNNCLVDGSKDSLGDLGGKRALLSDMSSYAEWTGSDRPLYPIGRMRSVPYDFFAYHIDSLRPERVNRTASDNISIDIEIDGRVDIMTAHSVYDGEREDSLLAYSYDTARKGINPVFSFEHKLAKLVFEAKAGIIADRKEKVLTIQDLTVESTNKAKLTVAYRSDWTGDGISFDENSVSSFQLKEMDGGEIPRDHYIVLNPPPAGDIPALRVGGCLLMAPRQSYTAYVTVREINESWEHEYVNEVLLEFPDGFNEGCNYLITLYLFGYMEVEPSVTLVPWNYGGDINLPDYEKP